MIGVLEGVFAIGQVYVLVSRVTDPKNFLLCGLPPKDLWEEVAEAWGRAGLNIADCWKRACAVTNEWVYDHQPDKPLKSRIQQRLTTERGIPLKNRTLAETLDPQPEASVVFKRLLDGGWYWGAMIPLKRERKCVVPYESIPVQDWIDRVDFASQHGQPRPSFETVDGEPIFPEGDDPWWLTDVSRRVMNEDEKKVEADEDGPTSDLEEEKQGEVSDSDAESEIRVGASSSGAHEPSVGWRS